MSIPKISEEPEFLDRTASRKTKQDQERSFICVPVKKGKQVIGALSVDKSFDKSYPLKQGQKLLSVVATMIAQQVVNLETIQREKDRSCGMKTSRLRGELEKQVPHYEYHRQQQQDAGSVPDDLPGFSRSNATVLIRGESGTGKELVANSIHYNSSPHQPAGGESQLCGPAGQPDRKRAFRTRKGRLYRRHQTKDAGKFETGPQGNHLSGRNRLHRPRRPVQPAADFAGKGVRTGGGAQDHQGGRAHRRRHQQATWNRRWRKETFRGDLYYRLNVFPIYLPPLQGAQDRHFAAVRLFSSKSTSNENGKDIRRFSTPAIDMLMNYHWPGNVRELENCIERAVLLCEEGVIHSYHLPPTLQTGAESDTLPAKSLEEAVANLEREMIIDSLKNTRGNSTAAAELLRTTVRKFNYKAKKYGVDYRVYR